MLNQLQKNNTNKNFFFGILLSLLLNTTLAQDRQFLINVSSNTTDIDYWWANKNNFGRENGNFDFQCSLRLKSNNNTYVFDISINS